MGRKNSSKLIVGISIPSFKISTTHKISIFLFLNFSKISDLSFELVFAVITADL